MLRTSYARRYLRPLTQLRTPLYLALLNLWARIGASRLRRAWFVILTQNEWRHHVNSGLPLTRGCWHRFPHTPHIFKSPPQHSTSVVRDAFPSRPCCLVCPTGGDIGPSESNPYGLDSPGSRPLLLARGLDVPPALARVTSSH